MWYPCKIIKEIPPTAEDEQTMLETGDFRVLQNKYVVAFTGEEVQVKKTTVPLDYIRMSREQQVTNCNFKIKEEQRKKREAENAELGDF